MRRIIDINEVGRYYTVTEDGMLWSISKNRWMKPQRNSCGYVFYFLHFGVDSPCWVFAHTLVALKYIGEPPTQRHEIDHLDGSRINNHYSNLAWVTHSQNVLKSYDRGRVGWWGEKSRDALPVTLETRMKMANAKKKRVVFSYDGGERVFESINEASAGLGTYRKKIYLCVKSGREFMGGYLRFKDDE